MTWLRLVWPQDVYQDYWTGHNEVDAHNDNDNLKKNKLCFHRHGLTHALPPCLIVIRHI